MTDPEREASEIVRGVLDACAESAGFRDYLDATSAGLDCSPPPWNGVDQTPFKERIVALAESVAAAQRKAFYHAAWQRAAMDLPGGG